MKEIWKDVIGYEGLYKVSNTGKVKSVGRSFEMCNRWNFPVIIQVREKELIIAKYKNHGYAYCTLSKNSKSKKFKMHRLISIHFIPNPNGFPFINHINAIRDDNRIENLEWCDHSHNMKHRFKMGYDHSGVKNPSARKVIDTSTKQIFDTVKEAADKFSLNYNTLSGMLNGHDKNHTTLNHLINK